MVTRCVISDAPVHGLAACIHQFPVFVLTVWTIIDMKKAIVLVGMAMAAASWTPWASAGAEWEYDGAEGPTHWGDLDSAYAECGHGKNQSPVNITGAVDANLPDIHFHYVSNAVSVVNNGHTVQVNYAPGSTIDVAGHTYELKQFHFHAPSENTINGESFPMEGHLVHADANGNLAVVAIMFREGKANATLQKAWEQMPASAGDPVALSTSLNATDLLPANHDYYQFSGSLTTPPCSEGVDWLVLKGTDTASAEQLDKFRHALHHANNRPVQPLNARIVIQ